MVENISLPQEVEQAAGQRTSMGVVGDLSKYPTQFQAAEALRDAAQNEGGSASMGAGLGAGMAMGQMMQGAFAAGQQPATPQPQAQTVPCVSCHKPILAASSARNGCQPDRQRLQSAAIPRSGRQVLPPSAAPNRTKPLI